MNLRRVQKRKGIGNVITTLIILIASVVLGAGVIFFGGSMFQTNTQSESIKVSNVHTWVNSNGTTVTAFAVQNTGSKAVAINSISLRGLPIPQTSWYSCTNPTLCATSTNINTDLPTQYNPTSGVPLGGTNYAMQTGPVSLTQGQAQVVYMTGAGNIGTIDAGNTYSLQVQSGQAIAVQQVQVISK
ncbi:MAG: hypothetical protein ABI361_05380 [Nitrososphaera sp.]|jgi:hypothetical protein